jgi:hypothetical protein
MYSGGIPSNEASPTLEIQVHRIGMQRPLRSPCFGGKEFGL